MTNAKNYPVYGWWLVTTEGDCEGRTTKNLGYHHGFLDEIALALGNKAYYALTFKWIDTPPMTETTPAKTVMVTLDIDSGMWDQTIAQRVDTFQKLLAGRPVTITPGNFFASVTINALDK